MLYEFKTGTSTVNSSLCISIGKKMLSMYIVQKTLSTSRIGHEDRELGEHAGAIMRMMMMFVKPLNQVLAKKKQRSIALTQY